MSAEPGDQLFQDQHHGWHELDHRQVGMLGSLKYHLRMYMANGVARR
jgi:hypothetical protein